MQCHVILCKCSSNTFMSHQRSSFSSCLIKPGPHYTECTTEECTGCPGGQDSDPGLVWKWNQTSCFDEQMGPERSDHWWRWALSSTDRWFLSVFALQGWALQSWVWIQWHRQGMWSPSLMQILSSYCSVHQGLSFVVHFSQGHVYNSTSRIRNRKEKRSWLGFAQVCSVGWH